MKRSTDLLLENLCLIEAYKELFHDYGYTKDRVDELIERLETELSMLYKVMCEQKWDFNEQDYN